MECAWAAGCEVQQSCSDECSECVSCLETAVRFGREGHAAHQSATASPERMAAGFVGMCEDNRSFRLRLKDAPKYCAAAGRSILANPELAHRQLALCTAASACSPACVLSAGEVLEGIHDSESLGDDPPPSGPPQAQSWNHGAEMCLHVGAHDSGSDDSNSMLPYGPIGAFHPVAVADSSDSKNLLVPDLVALSDPRARPGWDAEDVEAPPEPQSRPGGCSSATDCLSGHECRPDQSLSKGCTPRAGENEAACDPENGLDLRAASTCPLVCAERGEVEKEAVCSAAEDANLLVCESDSDCDTAAGAGSSNWPHPCPSIVTSLAL